MGSAPYISATSIRYDFGGSLALVARGGIGTTFEDNTHPEIIDNKLVSTRQ
jgi:hypothetical protein